MNLDDLKDKLVEKWNELLNQIQESSVYNNLREQYDSLTPDKQKLILVAGVGLVAVGIISIPMSYMSSASTNISQFNEVRQSLRNLFRIRSLPDLGNPLPTAFESGSAEAQIRNALMGAQLLPDQVESISEDAQFRTPLARPPIMQSAMAVSLKNLNSAQVIDIGKRLQTITSSTKLMAVDVKAQREKGNYFDVVYRVVNFYFPQEEPPAERNARPGARQPSRPAARPAPRTGGN